jgi:hypothetical protein
MTSTLLRWTLVGGLVLGGLAAAQPANDTCAGAQVLAPTTPGVPVVSTPVDITNAATTSESSFSCQSSNSRSIWFVITPTVSGVYRFETCSATATATTVGDTVIAVYTGSCPSPTQIAGACDDDGCSLQSSISVPLAAGQTYYVQAAKYGTTAPTASTSTLQVSATYLASHPFDECGASSPQLLLNTPVVVGMAGPDAGFASATNGAQLPGDGGCLQGAGNTNTTAPGRDVAYQFRASTGGSYSFRLSNAASSTPNYLLYLTNSCVAPTGTPVTYDAPVCRAAANRVTGSTSNTEEAWCVPMTANETFYVWFEESATTTTVSSATLEVTACTAESESNNTPAEASALAFPVTGAINASGDLDYYSLGNLAAGARVYALLDGASSNSNNYRLRVTTATDTIEFDEDDAAPDFGTSSSVIAGAPALGGPTYLQVSHALTSAQEPYRLYAVVQNGTPTPEQGTISTIATAFAAPSNYFSGTIGASTTEYDFYAFEAKAGDLAFLAVDGQPTRTGSTATGNHNVQLWNASASLVAAANSNTTVNNTVTTGNLLATTPAVPGNALWYRIRADGTYYARVARSTSTSGNTGDYVLSISLNGTTGGGIGVPTVTNLSPANGTTAGGTTVTLSGTGFASAATVRFGTTDATVVSREPGRIVVTTPAGSEGAVDVSVVNPGNQVGTRTGGFTYIAPAVPPTVTSVSPATATTLGGTVLTLNGTNFKASAEVTFDVGGDRRLGTAVTLVNSTRLTVETPAHVAGVADITVRNVVDDMSGTLTGQLTFIAPPVLTGLTPATGLTTGGQTVTLTGTGFRTGATVRFGTALGTGVAVATDGLSLTVVTPSATLNGPVNVSVTNSDGQVSTLNGAFTYTYPAPTVTGLTPTFGRLDGGLAITIAGTNFLAPQALPDGGTAGVEVTLGGVAATSVTRTSATRVTAVTPANPAGTVDLVLTNPDGQQATFAQSFRYLAPPTLSSITPARGPVQGGTRITLTGTEFLAGASVRVGGVPAFALSVVSPTEITAVTSAGAAGPADVTVTNFDGQEATLPMAFTYDPAPTLEGVSPIVGSTAGGNTVTLTGRDFRAGATVLFGTDPGTAVTVTSATELTAVAPAHAAGVVSVTVRNDDGQGSELARAYRFVAPPTVASATPNTGDVAGGTVVRLVGTGFGAQMTVTFDGATSPAVTLVSATELDVVAPPHAPGAVDVVVTTSAGVSATLTGGFTYTRAAPTVVAIAPATGPVAGGELVTITGTGFAAGATVTFDGAAATGVELGSSTLLRAVAPAHAAGAVDVKVTNDDGQSATLAGGFTYVAPPPGTEGLVADGGDGALVGEIDAGTGGGTGVGGGGCGCASVDVTTLAGLGLGLVTLLRRRRR